MNRIYNFRHPSHWLESKISFIAISISGLNSRIESWSGMEYVNKGGDVRIPYHSLDPVFSVN